jgi:DNA-binding NarL/FixJ family response regulator
MTRFQLGRGSPKIELVLLARDTTMALRILIVDDEPLVRVGVRLILERHDGWAVCGEAENGMEAIEKAIELRPDLVVLDVVMPKLDGLHAASKIREQLPAASILILTLYESLNMARLAAKAGASAYVAKSLIVKNLVPTIESLAPTREAKRPTL